MNGLCQVLLWVRTREAIAQARDLLFTTWRKGVKCVKNICMKLPYVAQQVGNAYFCRLTEINKRVVRQSVMNAWREKFTPKPIAGCGLFRHVDLTGVARHLNLGFRAWSRIRVISFRYHGFPYSTVRDFLDPNIRVIRGSAWNIQSPTRSVRLDFELNYLEMAVSYLKSQWNVKATNLWANWSWLEV